MATAKVQVTITYEYDAEYDETADIYQENERVSEEAQDTLRNLVGSSVSIVKGTSTVISDATVTSGGVSVATVPSN